MISSLLPNGNTHHQGVSEEYEQIYLENKDDTFSYIRKFERDADTCKDLQQETWIKYWLSHVSGNVINDPHAFALAIARNLCIDYSREIKRDRKNIHLYISFEILRPDYQPGDINDTQDENKKEAKKLLSCLTKQEQEIVYLHTMKDLTYKQISFILGKSKDSVRQMHSRAFKKMKSKVSMNKN